MPETAVLEKKDIDVPSKAELSREEQFSKGLLLTPEVLRSQGKQLFKEMGKITGSQYDRNIHRRMATMWTSLIGRKTQDEHQELLWTQTKDAQYPTMEVREPEGGGDPTTVEGHIDGDMVIEGYGDISKKHVESYIVQLNRARGERDRPYKIRIAPSGISLLTRNEETNTFEPDPNFPERFLRELQQTIQQLNKISK